LVLFKIYYAAAARGRGHLSLRDGVVVGAS
jgi:hypothetical protein